MKGRKFQLEEMALPTIGERIRDARIQRGMTQSELSSDLVTPSMISQIEANKARPSFQLLTSVANRLGLPVEHFMGELDNQFSVVSQIRLAEYYLHIHDPASAMGILKTLQTEEQQGLNFQERKMHVARAHRLLGEYLDAIQLLEELRETAFRGQDEMLHFFVCKESGQVEYDIGNATGAMHEWKKALRIGEGVLATDAFAQIKLRSDMAAVCTSLHDLYAALDDSAEASKYLSRAADLCAATSGLRTVADALAQDAIMALAENDPSGGKMALDQAISIVEAAQRVEQYILINVRLSAYDSDRNMDPWFQAAVATATVQPQVFLDAEVERIKRLIKSGDMDRARECIDRADAVLSYQMDTDNAVTMKQQVALEMAKSQLLAERGQLASAIEALEQLSDRLQILNLDQLLVDVWALLMGFLVQQQSFEEVHQLASKMEEVSKRIIQTRHSLV